MKKVFLSVFVIISFILYAYSVRVKGDAQTPVVVPNTIGKRIAATPTVTPVPPAPALSSAVEQPSMSESQPTATPAPTATPQPQGQYKDGSYTGSVADAFYGPLQVQVTIANGKISNVQFLQSPNDRSESIEINQQAEPTLTQEAIQQQSAQVDVVSGATQTSQAFVQSLQSALSQAKS
jgi:uncharacterized protein with FMN-binding domain